MTLGCESGFETVTCYTNTRWYFYWCHLLCENAGREKAEGWFMYLFSWRNLKMEWVDLAYAPTSLCTISVPLKGLRESSNLPESLVMGPVEGTTGG